MHAVDCSPSGITFLQVHDRMDEYRKVRQFSLTRKAEGQPHHRRRRGRHCEDLGPAHAWRQPRHRPQHLRGALGGGDACGMVPPPTRRLGKPLCPFPPCVTDSRRNEASSTWRMPSPPLLPGHGEHTRTHEGAHARARPMHFTSVAGWVTILQKLPPFSCDMAEGCRRPTRLTAAPSRTGGETAAGLSQNPLIYHLGFATQSPGHHSCSIGSGLGHRQVA